ncbi:MAG: hypothetical protein ACKV2V_12485 [Blastocatellia bacterium]
MTWIRTPHPSEDDNLRRALEFVRPLYPPEYATPVLPDDTGTGSITFSHGLMPETLRHTFAAYASMLSADLPLSRAQHEMIATMVSVTNHCFY